jgi:hypothetical protein
MNQGIPMNNAPSGRGKNGSRKGRWAGWELKHIEDHYGSRDDRAIARKLDRSIKSVRERAEEIFRKKPSRAGAPWTDEEDQRLKQCTGFSPMAKIALILARPVEDVRERLDYFGSRLESRPFTNGELKEFKYIYGSREDEHLAIMFGRPVEDIQKLAARLKLAKDKSSIRKWREHNAGARPHGVVPPMKMPRWTPEQESLLRQLYPDHSNVDIAGILERSVKSVMSKANDLKLCKSKEFLALMGKMNVSVRYRALPGGPPDAQTKPYGAPGVERESSAESE